MKTKLFSLLVVTAGLLALGARAQVATPSSLAPAVDVVSTPQANQIVYAPRLPSTTELTNVAAAQGLSIDKIVQTASQMTVVYRSANGQTNTVAYMLLPVAGSTTANEVPAAPVAAYNGAVVGTTTQTVIAAPSPAPQVVYATPAPAYYYDPFYYPAYYSYPWYSPVSVSIGWGFGYYGGHYHGGGYHGGGGFHGGHH